MRKRATLFIAGLLLAALAQANAASVGLIRINGPIGPATASYIARAIELAGNRKDACLVIELDTPGGLLDSTKDIVQKFYASAVPVVVYVAPQGANAGSGRRRHGAEHQHWRGASGFDQPHGRRGEDR